MPGNPDMDAIGKLGTASVVITTNTHLGTFPTRNYSEAQFENAEDLSGETMADTILKKRDTCYACVVRCKRVVEGEYEDNKIDPYYGGPEYETLGTFRFDVRNKKHGSCCPRESDLQQLWRRYDHLRCDYRLCH